MLPDTEATQVTIKDPNARDFLMDQLRKWTDYRIWILAGTSVGDGPATDSIIVRTDEDGTKNIKLIITAEQI